MNALVSGLKEDTIKIIENALSIVYGEGNIELVDLSSSMLRQRVRLATRGNGSIETVLIVLSKDAFNQCEGISEDLQNSDKFYLYDSDSGLVNYLNNKHNLNLKCEVSDNASSMDVSEYTERIKYLESKIEGLSFQVKDLESALEEVGGTSEATVTENTVDTTSFEKEREELNNSIEKLKMEKDRLVADLGSVSSELSDYKVKYSTQTGLISSKEKEIAQLKVKVEELSKSLVEKDLSGTEVIALESSLKEAQSKVVELEGKLSSKEEEVHTLKGKVSEKENIISTLKGKITDAEKAENSLSKISRENSTIKKENIELSSKNESMLKKISEYEGIVTELNQEIVHLKGDLEVLEKSTSRDTDIEKVVKELSELRSEYDKLQGNIYAQLQKVSNPKGNLGFKLLGNSDVKFKNIEFVYSGSSESRKGMYKCILNKIKTNTYDKPILIVDIVTETSIDYVFEMKSLKSGLSWFESGEGLDRVKNATVLSNVFVLSISGTSYINDNSFLKFNWLSVLTNLEKSGYHVVVVCGDLSSMVGRILHESFTGHGVDSSIYVHGNAICSRAVINNIRGLSNIKYSTVYYYEFNPQVQRYVDIVGKICKYKIVEEV